MKFYILFVCISVQILFASSKVLPRKFPSFCPASTPNYNKCMEKVFEQIGPLLLKGVRELNFPKLNPLTITSLSFNKTLVNEFISFSADIKNLQFWGFDKTRLENYEFNPQSLEGKLYVVFPYMLSKLENTLKGRLFGVDVDSVGFGSMNASNVDLAIAFKLKKVYKSGVEFYGLEKFEAKSNYDDVEIQVISKDPAEQPAADLFIDLYNTDHQSFIRAVQPIYEEAVQIFYKSVAEQIFASIPAKEFLPE